MLVALLLLHPMPIGLILRKSSNGTHVKGCEVEGVTTILKWSKMEKVMATRDIMEGKGSLYNASSLRCIGSMGNIIF